jgi:bacterioferritin
MKGNEKIIATMNAIIADEHMAIRQYMNHSEMLDNWGYDKLANAVQARAVMEMKHVEKLMGRILFLEGVPDLTKLKEIHVGDKVEVQFKNDHAAEEGAIKAYNGAAKQALDLGDNGTRDLLLANLKDEEDHINWIESQLDQIDQMGISAYLAEQIEG